MERLGRGAAPSAGRAHVRRHSHDCGWLCPTAVALSGARASTPWLVWSRAAARSATCPPRGGQDLEPEVGFRFASSNRKRRAHPVAGSSGVTGRRPQRQPPPRPVAVMLTDVDGSAGTSRRGGRRLVPQSPGRAPARPGYRRPSGERAFSEAIWLDETCATRRRRRSAFDCCLLLLSRRARFG